MKQIFSIALFLCLFSCNKNKVSAITAPDFDEYRERYLRMGFESGYLKGVLDEKMTPYKNTDSIKEISKSAASLFINAMNLK